VRWRSGFLAGAALALGFSGFAAGPGTPGDPVPIDPEDLAASIHVLTSDALEGRGTGSPGGEKAARFIAGEFRKIGLRPLGLAEPGDPESMPDGSGYFQPFAATVGGDLGAANVLSARFADRATTYVLDRDFIPSTLSGSGATEGKVVFAGYGIASRTAGRDDYGGRDIRGRIVLLLAGVPTGAAESPLAAFAGIYHKVVFARDKGAAAVVVAATGDEGHPSTWNTNRGFSDEGLPVVLVSRRTAAEWLGADGWTMAEVEEKLRSGPWPLNLSVAVSLATEVRKRRRVTANVAGLLEGSDPRLAREVVAIGAHYDHLGTGGPSSLALDRRPAIHHGADDNASGTAGLLALARRFAGAPRPRRSVLFLAFSGEELGLLGSSYYVRHPLVPIDRTVAMLNMDMIGRLLEERLAVNGTGMSPEWPSILREANRESGLRLLFTEEAFGASDQQSFYLGGVPVLSFFTGNHPEYHTPADTEEKINRTGEARVLGLVARCAAAVADGEARPAFRDVDPPPPDARRIALGIIPGDVPDDLPGLAIAETSVEGAARRAGLRPGDIIVRIGDHPVRSIHDYRIALSEFRPGDVVEGVVRRDGRELPFTAPLPLPAPSAR